MRPVWGGVGCPPAKKFPGSQTAHGRTVLDGGGGIEPSAYGNQPGICGGWLGVTCALGAENSSSHSIWPPTVGNCKTPPQNWSRCSPNRLLFFTNPGSVLDPNCRTSQFPLKMAIFLGPGAYSTGGGGGCSKGGRSKVPSLPACPWHPPGMQLF